MVMDWLNMNVIIVIGYDKIGVKTCQCCNGIEQIDLMENECDSMGNAMPTKC